MLCLYLATVYPFWLHAHRRLDSAMKSIDTISNDVSRSVALISTSTTEGEGWENIGHTFTFLALDTLDWTSKGVT